MYNFIEIILKYFINKSAWIMYLIYHMYNFIEIC